MPTIKKKNQISFIILNFNDILKYLSTERLKILHQSKKISQLKKYVPDEN